MFRDRLFVKNIFLLFAIGLLYLADTVFYFTWNFWWYDMGLHFMGGVSVALATLFCIKYFFNKKQSKFRVIWICLIATLFVGILWEVFELCFGLAFLSDGMSYFTDTSSDLVMDVLGGFFAALHSYKLLNKNNG